jgi:hypothetical protein
MANLAAVLPNHIRMEVVGAGREAVLEVDNHIEDGYIVLGDAPGLGVEFNAEELEKLAVAPTAARAGAVPSGRRRGAALYPVPAGEPAEPDLE